MADNPLEVLIADEREFDAQRLTQLLRRFVMLGKDSGKIIPRADFAALPEKYKILIFLLARKAAKELGLAPDELAAPQEISLATGVNYNSVRGYLSKFSKENLVQSVDSRYVVPSHAIPEIEQRILKFGAGSDV